MLKQLEKFLPAATNPLTPNHVPYVKQTPQEPYLVNIL